VIGELLLAIGQGGGLPVTVVPAGDSVTPWTSPVTLTLVGGLIVTVITAIAGAIVSIITAIRVTAVQSLTATNTSTVLEVAKSTAKIEGHVNSEKTASEGREHALRKENDLLREMLAERKSTAALLAQSTAISSGAGAATPPTPPSPNS